MAWKENKTLDAALTEAAWDSGATLRERLCVRIALLRPRKRQELELALTQLACETAAIPVAGDQIVEGVYVGSWQDLFQWILENWPKIIEMIMAIIALF